ncbi:MAG: hypothetical protein LBD01_00895 [Puniceicoccales bacterium]|jgi:hypothetical protein|nr:hypothetical protein [Puniceicoccales bacterium]
MSQANPFTKLFANFFFRQTSVQPQILEIDEVLPEERFPDEKPIATKTTEGEETAGVETRDQAEIQRASETTPTTSEQAAMPPGNSSWIGVDLDGTLAYGGKWQGIKHIGNPVPLMLARVKFWIKNGLQVKIFTARAANPEAIRPIKEWLTKHGLPELEITNIKDFDMIEYWDDRAIQVVRNTGRPFLSPSIVGRPYAPILEEEAEKETFYMLPKKCKTNPDET